MIGRGRPQAVITTQLNTAYGCIQNAEDANAATGNDNACSVMPTAVATAVTGPSHPGTDGQPRRHRTPMAVTVISESSAATTNAAANAGLDGNGNAWVTQNSGVRNSRDATQ